MTIVLCRLSGAVVLLATSLLLVGCGSSSPSTTTGQGQRTLTFNMYGDSNHPKLNGTVQVDIKGPAYTLTVTINGVDPNTLHNLHRLAGTCANQVAEDIESVDDVTADTTGLITSVTTWKRAYSVPPEGMILIVHDNDGLPHAHIGCAEMTN